MTELKEMIGRRRSVRRYSSDPLPETAMEALKLTDEDRSRIVMIGNNLRKDIAGANRQGMISVWLSWSPRYFQTVEEPDWQPDYTVATPAELIPLLHRLNKELERN